MGEVERRRVEDQTRGRRGGWERAEAGGEGGGRGGDGGRGGERARRRGRESGREGAGDGPDRCLSPVFLVRNPVHLSI